MRRPSSQKTRRGRARASLVTLAAVSGLALPSAAWAHALLTSPKPRDNSDQYKDSNGGPPCGVMRMASQPTTNPPLTAGASLNVTWNETVNHPGCFVIDFAAANDTGFQVLATVAHKSTGSTPRMYSQMVTLPSAPCTACTLRLRQIMLNAEPAAGACPPATIPTGATYYSCANVVLAGGGGGTGGAGGGGAGTGGRMGSGGSGNPASGGAGGGGGSLGTGGASTGGAPAGTGGTATGGASSSTGGATNPGSGGAVASTGGATNPGSGGAANPGTGGAGSGSGSGGAAGGATQPPAGDSGGCAFGASSPRGLSVGTLLFAALLGMTVRRVRTRRK